MKAWDAVRRGYRVAVGGAIVALLASCGPALAQTDRPTVAPVTPAVAGLPDGTPPVAQISCTNCSAPSANWADSGPGVYGYRHHGGEAAGCVGCDLGCGDAGCGEAGCHAGYPACDPCVSSHSRIGRLFCAFQNAVCCPDPCYEPRWVPAANAALFAPAVRPGTYTRLRWDYGNNLTQPDRAEYFWGAIGSKGPPKAETGVDYHELSLYNEFGTAKFSAFVDLVYRNQEGDINGGFGGFSELRVGTKSVLVDSDLVLSTFQFRTIIPIGNPSKGAGNGHVSLEPSLLYAVKLYTDTYWQGQLGYWIPISGTDGYAGGVVIWNNAINHVICRPTRDSAFIGSIETTGYTFTSGGFTGAVVGTPIKGNDETYFSIGPGFRYHFCDKLDVGFGTQFAVTSNHFAEQLYRTELRWRF